MSAFIKHSIFCEILTEKIGKFPPALHTMIWIVKSWGSEIRSIQCRTARQPLTPRILMMIYLCIFKNKAKSKKQKNPNPTNKSTFSSEADFGEITLISVGNNHIGWWKLYINIKGPLGCIKKNFSCSRKLKRKKKTKSWLPSSQLDWTHSIKSYDVLCSGDTKRLALDFKAPEKTRKNILPEGWKNLVFKNHEEVQSNFKVSARETNQHQTTTTKPLQYFHLKKKKILFSSWAVSKLIESFTFSLCLFL